MMQIHFPRPLTLSRREGEPSPLPHLGGGWNEGLGFLAALLCRAGRIHPIGLAALLLATATGALATTPSITAGERHALVLREDGSVVAWGLNASGQLGNETFDRMPDGSPPEQIMALGQSVDQLAAGRAFSMALIDGSVWTWGFNRDGQLGDGTTVKQATPVQVMTEGRVAQIAPGSNYALVLQEDGSVWGWGWNESMALGPHTVHRTGEGIRRIHPLPFQLLPVQSGMVKLVAGRKFALALQADGSVWGWGQNDFAQLGDGVGGAAGKQWPPVQLHARVFGGGAVTDLALGAAHVMALQADGSVWTWGHNYQGQLGHSPALQVQPAPMRVLAPGSGAVAIAAGFQHSMVLKADGSVWAWGRNNGGQLGDGTTDDKPAPVRVMAPGSGVVAIAAAGSHSLALKADGSIWEWGDRMKGQPHHDATGHAKRVPTEVPTASLKEKTP